MFVTIFKYPVLFGCVLGPSLTQLICSDVVLETKVLVSRRLEDKQERIGLGLGLDKKILRIFKTSIF